VPIIQLEAKKVINKGMQFSHQMRVPITLHPSLPIELLYILSSSPARYSYVPARRHKTARNSHLSKNNSFSGNAICTLRLPYTGITATQSWTTANSMTTKVELDDILAAGVKAEYIGTFAPKTGLKAQKGNLYFKQGAFHARAFGEFTPANGNVTAIVDGVVAHEGFLVGGEAGFDVQKAALTRYAAAFGYQTPVYSAAVTATNSLSVFAASYYHRVNPSVEAGVKAAYDTKSSTTVGIEVAGKYKLDPLSFAKV
jgi:Eukaryotic porin